jgi:hypothetical protein
MNINTITLPYTSNFIIKYEDADRLNNVYYTPQQIAIVIRRANLLYNSCENDLSILAGWFGVDILAAFGYNHRITVLFTNSFNGQALLGVNEGYDSSNIWIDPSVADDSGPANDDGVLGIFVAELSEILMGKGNWNRGYSNGEALSRVVAKLLHPGIKTFPGLRRDTQIWLTENPQIWIPNNPVSKLTSILDSHTSLRQDWITTNFTGENSVKGDGDPYSFGCGVLFIFFLKDQLGYSMAQIAQKGGDSLEETYQTLTGQTQGFIKLKNLLDDFFPGSIDTGTDNPFPLGGKFCTSYLTTGIDNKGDTLVQTGSSKVFFLTCGGTYNWSIFQLNSTLQVFANFSGFAHPQLSWSINGVKVTSAFRLMNVMAEITPINEDISHTEDIQITTDLVSNSNFPTDGSILQITTNGYYPGRIRFDIQVSITDQFADKTLNQTQSFLLVEFNTLKIVWEDKYYLDMRECVDRYWREHTPQFKTLRSFMPDPPPELLNSIALFRQLSIELHALKGKDSKAAHMINKSLGGFLLSDKNG